MVRFVSQLLWQYWKTVAWHLQICSLEKCGPWASCYFTEKTKLSISSESSARADDSHEISCLTFLKKSKYLLKLWLACCLFVYSRSFNLHHSLGWSSRQHIDDTFLIFPRKQVLTFHADCLQWRQFTRNVKTCFLGKVRKYFKMTSAEIFTQSAKC